jgi:hypothetical protein
LIAALCCGCLDFVMRIARTGVDALRLALAREQLGVDPVSPPAKRAPGILHTLFVSREPLGHETESPQAKKKPGVLHILFVSREPLGFEPVPPPARRRSRLAALFAPERLDDSP